MMKKYKLYGKDRKRKRYNYITIRQGRSKATVLRTFKMRSRWPCVKAKLVK